MPEESLDTLADALYTAPPAQFVGLRDDAVKAARERGDREFATAAARFRRPTRAAWLANLLARHRPEQLDALLGMAGSLADAQRTLDGAALRALSSQRRKLVAAMAREAGQLAREAHEPAGDGLLREVAEILEAALADPVVADEVRSGRLTRTVSYTGFGPAAEAGTTPRPAPAPPRRPEPEPEPEPDAAAAERERERAARREEFEDAERDERRARKRRDAAEAAHEAAVAAHGSARDRVAALVAELEAARDAERESAARARTAEADAKAAVRDSGAAATRTARARARLDEVS
jgi:hypothetical protein